MGAVTGKASTVISPELGRAIDQKVAAEGRVEDLTLLVGAGGPTLGVGAANAIATATCVPGSTTPVFAGDSRVADITLGGTPIALDRLVTELTNVLNPLVGDLVEVVADERIRTADSLTIRALHVRVLRRGAPAPLVDLVVGEAKVAANGPVCDPTRQNDGSGDQLGRVCPAGSVLVSERTLCVIPAGAGGSGLGEIIVGRPFQGPSGGTVVPIDVARRRYGRSPCLGFAGNPKFAIVGTNRADRITGTNVADRIIGLGGNDRLDGGPGTDHLSAGSGNDTINAAFGRDRALGGSGRDFINIATAGPAASANCGTGPDKVRINRNERRRVRGCETIYVFRDR